MSGYDTIKPIEADFEALEKKRLERAARAKKNQAKIKPYLNAIAGASDADSYVTASDHLSREHATVERVEPWA